MGTANTMACMVETIGLSLPRCATMPALDHARESLCRRSGQRIVQLVRDGVQFRHILTESSLKNAVRVCLAIDGSTNATLHLPAVASENGAAVTLATFDWMSRQTPKIGNSRPASRLSVVDLHEAGGRPRPPAVTGGFLALYSQLAQQANRGAVLSAAHAAHPREGCLPGILNG